MEQMSFIGPREQKINVHSTVTNTSKPKFFYSEIRLQSIDAPSHDSEVPVNKSHEAMTHRLCYLWTAQGVWLRITAVVATLRRRN